jgi:hypothetical protein
MTGLPPALTAKVDQARAAAALAVDHLLNADTAGTASGISERERWISIWAGAADSGSTRETLAGVLATAVGRLGVAAAQVDRVYADGRRAGRQHAVAAQLRRELDLQSGPANASGPVSAGGPGWDREHVEAIIGGFADIPAPVDAAQLRALLADRDRLAGRDRALRVEAEISNGLRAELAEVTESEIRARAELGRLEEELVGARSECDRLRDALTNSRAAASDRKADADKIAHDLITERNQAVRDVHAVNEALRAATAEQATARRDAAAEALDEAATALGNRPVPLDPYVGDWLRLQAAEVRAGTRPVPGSPEPAQHTPTQPGSRP